MKRRWEERTELEEMLISIIQDIGRAFEAHDDDELFSLLEDKVAVLDHAFTFIPWEFPHAANENNYGHPPHAA